MKKKIEIIAKVALMLAIGVWVLSIIPFNQKINQELSATIYKNGVAVKETTVHIEGEKSNYLFGNDNSFHGKFQIQSYEKTSRKGMNANIFWDSEYNKQRLLFSQNATSSFLDTIGTILINEKMTNFALMFTDGTMIATSDKLHKLYTKHISYNSDTGTTVIKAVNEIPKIK